MPLTPGSSRATISKNIREMIASGYPQKQAVAASLHNADKPKRVKVRRKKKHSDSETHEPSGKEEAE
jgi:hypothetical protein